MGAAAATRPVLLAALASLTLPACGTLVTRLGDGPVFGAYPFEAVVLDVGLVGGAFGAEKNTQSRADGEAWMGLVSLPFDLVLDAVLTPVDLVAWAFGVRKGGWSC